MTQEQKDLLLKDLCARLPYGVNVQYSFKCTVISTNKEEIVTRDLYLHSIETLDDMTVSGIDDDGDNNICFLDEIKPYLFPLSSMTEEQYYEMMSYSSEDCLDHMKILKSLRECTDFTHWPLYEYRVIDWYNKNHFDYRGLIPMGLAIDATGLNIY